MIMIPGSGSISDYGNYISNCTKNQLKYKIPVNSLADVQLFINIGVVKPSTVIYELIPTCGVISSCFNYTVTNNNVSTFKTYSYTNCEGQFIFGSVLPLSSVGICAADGSPATGSVDISFIKGSACTGVEILTTSDYVIAQDKKNNWYGVFKNFTGSTATCFVIAITIDDQIYFSEEYCIENSCNGLVLIKGCYGNLDALISTDCEGIYFGTHAGSGTPLGDTSIKYNHELLLRGVEVTLSAIKNSFKQGRTRNFRTEKEKVFQFWSELVPEWYLSEIDAVFYRGEVYIGSTKYLLNETTYEKLEECYKTWKPSATFKESCFQSFSCEADPCGSLVTDCCDPVIDGVLVTEVALESGFPGDGSGGTFIPAGRIVVIQAVVDSAPNVTGTTYTVTGIIDGSFVITCDAFKKKRVYVERGNIFNPGIDPEDGSQWHTKVLADNFITFNTPLVNGEFIYIETIP